MLDSQKRGEEGAQSRFIQAKKEKRIGVKRIESQKPKKNTFNSSNFTILISQDVKRSL